MLEEEEIEINACSCDTIIYDANGKLVSSVASALEAPITGRCSDHNSYVIDEETDYLTQVLCL